MANGGAYTDAQVNAMLKAAHKNVIDQICMAFLVDFLPPDLRSKILEKKPAMMRDCTEAAADHQRIILDINCPLGSNPKPQILAVDEDDSNWEDTIINAVQKHFNKRGNQTQSNGANKGKGKEKGIYPDRTNPAILPLARSAPTARSLDTDPRLATLVRPTSRRATTPKVNCFTSLGPTGNEFKPAAPLASGSLKDFTPMGLSASLAQAPEKICNFVMSICSLSNAQ